MKKKTLLLGLTICCTGLGVMAITLSNTSFFVLNAETRKHTVSFDTSNIVFVSKEGINSNFRLSKENAFEDLSGNKYTLTSNSIGTYFGGNNDPAFGGDHFVSFVSDYEDVICISFDLINEAYISANSYFKVNQGSTLLGIIPFEAKQVVGNYTTYRAEIYLPDLDTVTEAIRGQTVTVDEIQIEFTCGV